MNTEELEEEFVIWRSYTQSRVPNFYPGILDTLAEFRARGGKVAVVSHSEAEMIRRDYRVGSNGTFEPDLIYGWNHDEARRKPHPWPVEDALHKMGLQPTDAVIVDDLKPAVLMGNACGVAVAAAGWGHNIDVIRNYMKRHCVAYLENVNAFRSFLLD